MITKDLREKIVAALMEKRANFVGSDAKFSVSVGINSAQFSRIRSGETERILSDAVWISLARNLGVGLGNAPEWKTALTPAFQFITAQLRYCQDNGASRLLCDVADIGKTYTAQTYARNNKSAVYVDCSQVKTRQRLVRHIAREFGVGHTGKYTDVYGDLVFYLKTLPAPLIILDEAGDLDYAAFLELKALWNATERACGWYMMGADGLQEKIRRSIEYKKVGYTELFSRYGNKYQKASPETAEELKTFKVAHVAMIAKANAPEGANIQTLVHGAGGSLRRLYDDIKKIRTVTA
jgi:Uncharacterized ATPase, putative transposase